jgi:hypothetical protein
MRQKGGVGGYCQFSAFCFRDLGVSRGSVFCFGAFRFLWSFSISASQRFSFFCFAFPCPSGASQSGSGAVPSHCPSLPTQCHHQNKTRAPLPTHWLARPMQSSSLPTHCPSLPANCSSLPMAILRKPRPGVSRSWKFVPWIETERGKTGNGREERWATQLPMTCSIPSPMHSSFDAKPHSAVISFSHKSSSDHCLDHRRS